MEVETREDDKRWKIVKVMDKRVSWRVEIEGFFEGILGLERERIV